MIALKKLMIPSYQVSPEEQEKSNEAEGFPARLGNIGICAAIIGPQGRIVISSGRNRFCLGPLSAVRQWKQ